MEKDVRDIIVISAVNLRKGGTLTILKDCLDYLSSSGMAQTYRIVALVHKRELCNYPGIEYIEMPRTINNWFRRIFCEYVSMYGISKQLGSIRLWFSLHDTTPNVKAERRVVYCHNPFPFYEWKWKEFFLNYKIVLFAWFSKWIYRINIHKNYKVIVQQKWIREEFIRLFNLPEKDIIVAMPPKSRQNLSIPDNTAGNKVLQFMYASFCDVHKNFETLLNAAYLLEQEVGVNKFKVVVTISKGQNKYTAWLWSKWGNPSSPTYTKSIEWVGFLDRAQLYYYYSTTNCLVFPSKVETWGLPITEFALSHRPMILPDLPYAHETAAGHNLVALFDPSSAKDLASKMKSTINHEENFFKPLSTIEIKEPISHNWKELFDALLFSK